MAFSVIEYCSVVNSVWVIHSIVYTRITPIMRHKKNAAFIFIIIGKCWPSFIILSLLEIEKKSKNKGATGMYTFTWRMAMCKVVRLQILGEAVLFKCSFSHSCYDCYNNRIVSIGLHLTTFGDQQLSLKIAIEFQPVKKSIQTYPCIFPSADSVVIIRVELQNVQKFIIILMESPASFKLKISYQLIVRAIQSVY